MSFSIELGDDLIERLADRVAAIVGSAPAQQYFRVQDAADYVRTTPQAIKGYVKRGQLDPIRRKPYLLFDRDSLDELAHREWA
jgi:hypothetical protein